MASTSDRWPQTPAAIGCVLAWSAAERFTDRRPILTLFGVNDVLNLGWSVLFFQLKRPDAGAVNCRQHLSVALSTSNS